MKQITFSLRMHILLLAFSIFFVGLANGQDLLSHIGSIQLGEFDEGAAEILDFDPISMNLFVTNADSATIDVIDISNPAVPVKIYKIDISSYGDGVTSVSVKNGVVAAAIVADPVTDPGMVIFYETTAPYSLLNQVTVGALPDMVVFTNDGNKVLVANEGEPDGGVDPEGTISIIDISGGIASAVVTSVNFNDFDNLRHSLVNKGVRLIDPTATVSQDLEPEYIAITADDVYAYVGLQEANAVAVIDIANATVKDIMALGLKDHSKGAPHLNEYYLNKKVSMPALGTPVYDGGETVFLGGFSGLYYDDIESTATEYVFYAIPDRGPNAAAVSKANVSPPSGQNLRPFKLPDYQARIVKFSVNINTGAVTLNELDQIYLTRTDGITPISGKGNVAGVDEVPVTYTDPINFPNQDYQDNNGVWYHELPYDEFGGDFEGILKDKDGNFWLCDEYRPAIYKFDASGKMIDRFIAQGTAALGGQPVGTFGSETLPEVYTKRWANRGFEAIAYDTDNDIIYAFIQSPMYNPNSGTKNNSDVIRIIGVDLSGNPVEEYVYLLERNRDAGFALGRVDKIGDACYIGGKKFIVLERDSSIPGQDEGKKYVYTIDLNAATNILGTTLAEKMTSTGPTDLTLEMCTAWDLDTAGIKPVFKIKELNLPSVGYLPSDKPEGLALLPGGSFAVINDNDFGLAGAGVSDNSVLGIIDFSNNYAFDASNTAPAVDITNHPTLGMFMPDGMRSFTINGMNYFITTNEGDARDQDERIKNITLDPTVFPDAATLQEDDNLGRLNISLADGDIDGDGDYDYLYSYGARSFTIFDMFGNLVFDSGDGFEQNTFAEIPAYFNSTNDDNDSFKNRSDDKGPEPETVEIATIKGRTFAFVGLERVGGVIVYDISNPYMPGFVQYINNRDFTVPADDPSTGDLGPEDIKFLDGFETPDGNSYIAVANEVSGTVSLYSVDEMAAMQPVTVSIFHNNDGESQLINAGEGLENYGGVHNFKAKLDSLRGEAMINGNEHIMLSSGDNFLAGPEFNASLNLPASEPYYDAVAMDYIGYDAVCIGNHDFDFGPDVLSKFIQSYSMTQPPYLSANLDFSAEDTLQNLVDQGRVLASTVVNKNGNEFGVIGLTTEALPYISSPRGVVVDPDYVSIVQAEIDNFTANGINKVILISHLQSIEEEKDLAGQLNDIDIMIAGGGDELLTNDAGIALPGMTVYGPYPLIEQDIDGDDVYLVTTPGEYVYIGNLIVNFDAMGVVTSIDGASNPVLVNNSIADPNVYYEVVKPVEEYVADLAANLIGVSEVELDGVKSHVRTRETNEGNLIADALLWQADQLASSFGVNNPDVALQNGGGIRNNNFIPAGDISELTTFDMCPFANFVSVVENVPPAKFKEILENCVSRVEFTDGRFAQVAGMMLVYDSTGTAQVIDVNGTITTPGTRVMEAILDDGTPIITGGVIAPAAPDVTIATINFLAAGGDQYPFAPLPYTTMGVTYQQAVYNFIVDELGGLIANENYQINGEGRVIAAPYSMWTGIVDNDWFNTANWSNGVPLTSTNIFIESDSKANPPVIVGGTAQVMDMHILVGGSVEIAPTGALTSDGTLTVNGDLVIASDITGAAGSYIDNGTIEGNGMFAFNRHMLGTGTLGANEGWHYLSSPLDGLMSMDIVEGYFLNTWDEASNMWVHHDDVQAPMNIGFESMAGWSVKQDLNYVGGTGDFVEFTGNIADLHTGTYAGNFTASELESGDPNNLNNWNLMGNPYPSPMDAAAISFPAQMNASVYFWNDVTLAYESWAGGVGSQYIPAAQGFFVKAILDGSLTVDNSTRTHNGANTYYKSSIDDLLTLEVSGADHSDVTYIRFANDATEGFDRVFDAYKLYSPAGVPQLYTVVNGISYSINAMQPVEMVNLSFKSNFSGLYTINALETSEFNEVYLEDVFNGEIVNLLESDYSFEHTTDDDEDRFIVHFAPLSVQESELLNVQVYAWDSKIYINYNESGSAKVHVFNLLGQEVVTTAVQKGMNVIDLNDESGYYIIEVVSDDAIKTSKVYVK